MNDDRVSLTFRAPASYLERADAVLAEMDRAYRGPDPLGLWGSVRLSRSLVLRSALGRGLEVLEQEVGIAPATPDEPAPPPRKPAAEPDDTGPASTFLREYRKPSSMTKPATEGGGLLRKWRQGEGLNQRQAAELVGIGQSGYSAVETGKRQPTPTQVAKLATLTGIDPTAWTTPADGEG